MELWQIKLGSGSIEFDSFSHNGLDILFFHNVLSLYVFISVISINSLSSKSVKIFANLELSKVVNTSIFRHDSAPFFNNDIINNTNTNNHCHNNNNNSHNHRHNHNLNNNNNHHKNKNHNNNNDDKIYITKIIMIIIISIMIIIINDMINYYHITIMNGSLST